MYFLTLITNILTLFKRYYALFRTKIYLHPPVFTIAEVEEHKNDRWIIIDDDVYCLASMYSHSGGLDIIAELAGKDVTRIFYEVHLTSDAIKQLVNQKYWIGKVHRSTEVEKLGYFLKENLIKHKTVPECKIPQVITIDEECATKEQFKQYVAKSNFPCLNAKLL